MAIVPPFSADRDDLLYALLTAWQTGITDIIMRAGSADLVAGANTVTFQTPFTASTSFIIIPDCADASGPVDYVITAQSVTGFSITVSAACTCKFIAQQTAIVNNTYRIGSLSLSEGANSILFQNPYPADTTFIIIPDCYDAGGPVDYVVTAQSITGFSINVSAACTCKFVSYKSNDVPVVT